MSGTVGSESSEAYFDSLAHKWSELTSRSERFQQRYRVLEGQIRDHARDGSRALDYGCGTGTMCDVLASYAGEVIGTDQSREMRELARKRLVDNPFVRIVEIDEVERYRFDLVLCSSVIEYVKHDALFLKDLTAYLAPRGTLMITFPNRSGAVQLLQRHVLSRFDSGSYIHQQVNTYSRRSIRRLVEGAGLELRRLYAPVGLPGFRHVGLGDLIFCIAQKPT